MSSLPLSPQQSKFANRSGGALSLYKEMVVGNSPLFTFLSYEIITLLTSGVPGILGLGLRSLLYPMLLKRCDSRPGFGRGMTIRGPQSIEIGRGVVVDDYGVLDARGADAKIILGDYVAIGRFSSIIAKNGTIQIGSGSNISSSCRIATQSSVRIGESCLIAAYSYIGPGNHHVGPEGAVNFGEMELKGGVTIGNHCWIGAHTTIMDGVTIGDNSVVGANSFVRESIPPRTIVGGVPARVLKALNPGES
jgi:acetyltransferase-like isoleucine patch superfamily enzyme